MALRCCPLSHKGGTGAVQLSLPAMKPRQPHAPLRGFDQVLNGHKVHLLEERDSAGPPVLLLHGCGSLAQEVLAPFRNAGLHIVAPDRPGYGFSDPLPQGQRGPLAQSQWLEELADALGFGSLTIAGHSIGCAPAILLAQRRPDLVRSLVLIAPFCRPTPEQAMVLLRLAVAPGIGGVFSQQVLYRFADYFGGRVMRKAHYPNPVPDTLADFPYRHAASPQSLRMMADELLGSMPIWQPSALNRSHASPISSTGWTMLSLIRTGTSTVLSRECLNRESVCSKGSATILTMPPRPSFAPFWKMQPGVDRRVSVPSAS
ncbi:alpha/beta hydrolase [Rhizobium sp. SIMBA_035]